MVSRGGFTTPRGGRGRGHAITSQIGRKNAHNEDHSAKNHSQNSNNTNAANIRRRRPREGGPATPAQLGLKYLNHINPNPGSVDLQLKHARFFVIKSYSEDDVHKVPFIRRYASLHSLSQAVKYNIWTSTDAGNKRLDRAFSEQNGKPIYLFFSVNASGKFCGVAEMTSAIDHTAKSNVWNQSGKWNGQFSIR